jgi:large subunit ribosomal protein L13
MKTFSAKAQDVQRKWWVVDAENKVLGDVAVTVANVLRGKNKPIFTPHVDTGDFVVVINAEKVVLTGKKEEQKIYTRVSGYIGSQKSETPKMVRAKHPELLIERAVKGMIPKNTLGRNVFSKLRVYAGTEHPHAGQQPQPLTIA